jgi:uncharacterized integral membrane protein (TIGR00697 family)
MKPSKLNLGLISSGLYISFQLFANILSTKIVLIPGINFAVDGGTIIYPFTFTLRDFVHKTWGRKNARQVVILAAALNVVMVFLFWVIGKMIPDPSWGYQEAYQHILLPVFRITGASIVAQVVSELLDTEVFSAVYKKFNDVVAVLASNFVGLIADSFIFVFIAFLGVLPFGTVMQIIAINIAIKFIMSVVSSPLIKLIPQTAQDSEI